MAKDKKAAGPASDPSERRTHPRYAVEEDSVLLLVSHGMPMKAHINDLSLEGCRICTEQRCPPGTGLQVEVTFKVNGIAFRFSGVIRWNDGNHLVGIRFNEGTQRRREQLAEVVCEIAAAQLAQPEKQAEEQAKVERLPEALADGVAEQPEPLELSTAAAAPPQRPERGRLNRRNRARLAVHSFAVIYLVKTGSKLVGRIVDLSLSGCRIRTDEPFPVGIYTRVEAGFHLDGLPFRLGGVTQAIHDRHNVGIRFLDMTDRSRERVEGLIEELEALRRAGE